MLDENGVLTNNGHSSWLYYTMCQVCGIMYREGTVIAVYFRQKTKRKQVFRATAWPHLGRTVDGVFRIALNVLNYGNIEAL